jgi:hypothetical protein
MNNEIKRRDKKIADDKKLIGELREEIEAMRQLLDCAAANIAMLVKEQGGKRIISADDVKKALGNYRLFATKDKEGNYILEICENI